MLFTVRHILQIKGSDIWSISPKATVYDALRMMSDKDIGALLVMEGDTLVGILSERDYARKIILHGKALYYVVGQLVWEGCRMLELESIAL